MSERADGTERRLWGGILRAVGLIATIAALAVAWRGQQVLHFGPGRPDGIWMLGAGLVALTVLYWVGGALLARHETAPGESRFPAGLEIGGFAAAIVLGVTFRLLYLESVPEGLNHDAAWNGMYAIHINQGAPYTPYVSSAWGRETAFMYIVAAFLPFVDDRIIAVELAAATSGIAALVLFYFLARAMLGRRIALVSLGFFAVSGWHWVFSRVGWRCITVPPFEIIALFGLWRGLQGAGLRYWLVAGAGAGLSINTYDAGRAVPAVMAGLFIVFFALDRKLWKERLKGALTAAVSFAVVGGPMLWYAATHWVEFQGRAKHLMTQRTRDAGFFENLLDAAVMFNFSGNGNDFFVHDPLLEPLAAILFVFGVGLVVVRAWRRENLFLLLGFALSLLPGLLALPNGNRCITVMPYVYLAVGVGAVAAAEFCSRLLPKGARAWAMVAIVALMIGVASTETYRQFLGESRRLMIGFSPGATAAGELMREYGDDYRTYVVAERWPQYTLSYLGYSSGNPLEPHYVKGRALSDIEGEINRFGRKGLLFITDRRPSGLAAFGRLQQMFAEHEVRPITARRSRDVHIATALIVPPKSAARSGLWSNVSRSLLVEAVPGEADAAGARRCFPAVSTARGVSVRAKVMLPEAVEGGGHLRFHATCAPDAEAALEVDLGRDGLIVRADTSVVALPPQRIEAGRWYDVAAVVGSDGVLRVHLDGKEVSADQRLASPQLQALSVATGSASGSGRQLYVDDLAIVAGSLALGDSGWRPGGRHPSVAATYEDFEAIPLGQLHDGGGWQDVSGKVVVGLSPHGTGVAAGEEAANAFDSSRGDGPGQFDEPAGVALDRSGNIFVTERLNHRVQRFSPDGTLLGSWGQAGDREGQFREPLDVAVDEEFVYVVDTWNHRVQGFDHQGNFAFVIRPEPALASPRGIFVKDGRIYVANSGRSEVVVFDRAGVVLQTIRGSEDSPLRQPVDVVIDSKDRIYVVNGGLNRLEIFSADGERLGAIPVTGWQGEGLKENYLAIDAEDTIYLTDWDVRRVRRFRPDGTELEPAGPQMQRPSGVAIGAGRMVVAARGDHGLRLQEMPGVEPPRQR